MQFIYYFILVLFFILHSFFAATKIKKKAHQFVLPTTFRLFYNSQSAVLLLLAGWLYLQIDHTVLFEFYGREILGWSLIAIGSVLGYISFSSYNTAEFLGFAEENELTNLSVDGMNKYVRHPLYFATLILLLGGFFIAANFEYLGFMILSIIYLIVGTLLEEKKLIVTFGQEYLDYKKNVPMIIPNFFIK